MAGLQLADALEQGLAGEAELEGEVVLQPLEVGLDRGQHRQQRLRLGGEVEDVVDDRVVEGLDPEAVAGADQLLGGLVPDRVGEHPAQPLAGSPCPQRSWARRTTSVSQRGRGSRPPISLRQLGVVVDLAVVGDPAPGLVGHRLVAVLEVDDAEAAVAEADVAALVDPDRPSRRGRDARSARSSPRACARGPGSARPSGLSRRRCRTWPHLCSPIGSMSGVEASHPDRYLIWPGSRNGAYHSRLVRAGSSADLRGNGG